MGYGLKRLLEIEAEKKRKREERERIKTEKEKKKLEERKLARKKKLKKKQNQKYYAKQKAASEAYHKSVGDEKGTFSIYLMKNGKRLKYFGKKRYKVAALQQYYKLLEENNKSVIFPQKFTKLKDKIRDNKYELLLVKRIDESKEDPVTSFRNEDGKFVKNFLIDSESHKILDKNEWLIEEHFSVYGFNPITDKKDYKFIYDNIVLKHPDKYTRIFVYKNKLIHHYDDDFDMIMCKTSQLAEDLYNRIEQDVNQNKIKTILFMGKVQRNSALWIIDEIQKKTGWSRTKCQY